MVLSFLFVCVGTENRTQDVVFSRQALCHRAISLTLWFRFLLSVLPPFNLPQYAHLSWHFLSPAGQCWPICDKLSAQSVPAHCHCATAWGAPLPVPHPRGQVNPCTPGWGDCYGWRWVWQAWSWVWAAWWPLYGGHFQRGCWSVSAVKMLLRTGLPHTSKTVRR